jgi:thiamine-monophosphate kinase
MEEPNGEFAHVAWIRAQTATNRLVAVGPGDDAAVLRVGHDLLATTDMLVEGVHFTFDEASPYAVGRKAMNVNLSDVAAMAGKPQFALVAVALPPGTATTVGREIFRGMQEAAARFGVVIVGGDTNRSPTGVVVSATVLGAPTGRGPALRSGAKPGDALCVTGTLGYSRRGKHLDFTPRVVEAQRLHARFSISAMMDLSDGLGGDLFHLLSESQVGAVVDAEALPISAGFADDRSPLAHALDDGEDFELLFTLPADEAHRLLREQPLMDLGTPIAKIGDITADRAATLRTTAGSKPFPKGGFVHRC